MQPIRETATKPQTRPANQSVVHKAIDKASQSEKQAQSHRQDQPIREADTEPQTRPANQRDRHKATDKLAGCCRAIKGWIIPEPATARHFRSEQHYGALLYI